MLRYNTTLFDVQTCFMGFLLEIQFKSKAGELILHYFLMFLIIMILRIYDKCRKIFICSWLYSLLNISSSTVIVTGAEIIALLEIIEHVF